MNWNVLTWSWPAYVLVALLVIFVVTVFLLIRRSSRDPLNTPDTGQRGRRARLGVIDSFEIDRQRRLVLLRRDNVEHLVMIGGPNDVLIEPAIRRAATQAQRAPVPGATKALPGAPMPADEAAAPRPPARQEQPHPAEHAVPMRAESPSTMPLSPKPLASSASATRPLATPLAPRLDTTHAGRAEAERAPLTGTPDAPDAAGGRRVADADLAAMAHKLEEALRRPVASATPAARPLATPKPETPTLRPQAPKPLATPTAAPPRPAEPMPATQRRPIEPAPAPRPVTEPAPKPQSLATPKPVEPMPRPPDAVGPRPSEPAAAKLPEPPSPRPAEAMPRPAPPPRSEPTPATMRPVAPRQGALPAPKPAADSPAIAPDLDQLEAEMAKLLGRPSP